MSTIERINDQIYFEFPATATTPAVMITKTSKGWYTLQGEKFNRVNISNFVRNKNQVNRGQVAHVRSILNRFFNYDLGFQF